MKNITCTCCSIQVFPVGVPMINPHTLKDGPGAWEHIVFGTDEAPEGLPGNIERFTKMLEANNVPPAIREKMWGKTMAENLGIDSETHRFIT